MEMVKRSVTARKQVGGRGRDEWVEEKIWEAVNSEMSTEELMLLNCGVGEDLRVPWTARRSNQSILKEISPEYSNTGRTDAEAETPILWLGDAKN